MVVTWEEAIAESREGGQAEARQRPFQQTAQYAAGIAKTST